VTWPTPVDWQHDANAIRPDRIAGYQGGHCQAAPGSFVYVIVGLSTARSAPQHAPPTRWWMALLVLAVAVGTAPARALPDRFSAEDAPRPRPTVAPDSTALSTLAQQVRVSVSGTITTPRSGERVRNSFPVAGRLSSMPKPEQHVWVAVKIGGAGLFPKRPEIRRRSWQMKVFESATRFSLVLVLVNDADHRRIVRWFERGKKTGSFAPLRLPSKRQLDQVIGLA
jgi:hypothetical protein